MPKVAKVTVSLPETLLAYVESERSRTGSTRSETIAAMLWQVRHEAELHEREARYAAAYARHPETEEERGFGYAAAADLFADAGAEWVGRTSGSAKGPGVTNGRKEAASSARRAPARRAPTRRGAQQVAAIRTWARAHGYSVAEKGRIPVEIEDAYATKDAAPASKTAKRAQG
jgi:hypothetical protein